MKTFSIVILSLPLLLNSCAPLNGPALAPRADVESIERQAPVTNKPDVGEGAAGRNAARYINGNPYGYGYGYGRSGYRY